MACINLETGKHFRSALLLFIVTWKNEQPHKRVFHFVLTVPIFVLLFSAERYFYIKYYFMNISVLICYILKENYSLYLQ